MTKVIEISEAVAKERVKVVGEELIVRGKHGEKIKEIKRLKTVIENMFNHIPSITKNIPT